MGGSQKHVYRLANRPLARVLRGGEKRARKAVVQALWKALKEGRNMPSTVPVRLAERP